MSDKITFIFTGDLSRHCASVVTPLRVRFLVENRVTRALLDSSTCNGLLLDVIFYSRVEPRRTGARGGSQRASTYVKRARHHSPASSRARFSRADL